MIMIKGDTDLIEIIEKEMKKRVEEITRMTITA